MTRSQLPRYQPLRRVAEGLCKRWHGEQVATWLTACAQHGRQRARATDGVGQGLWGRLWPTLLPVRCSASSAAATVLRRGAPGRATGFPRGYTHGGDQCKG